jgi:hypothetical protein
MTFLEFLDPCVNPLSHIQRVHHVVEGHVVSHSFEHLDPSRLVVGWNFSLDFAIVIRPFAH